MRRRQLLAALGTTMPLAGCLSTVTGNGSPGESTVPTAGSVIDVTAPTVSPGGTATITINAQSVIRLRFSDVPDIDATLQYESAEFSPSPSTIWDVKPPTWEWASAGNVAGDVPLAVSESSQPGDYQYAIAVQQDDSEEEVTEAFTVTVKA